jgi:hypothetical protein
MSNFVSGGLAEVKLGGRPARQRPGRGTRYRRAEEMCVAAISVGKGGV